MVAKIKQWQRDELLRVHRRDGYPASRLLAKEYGVSQNYGAVLDDRTPGKVRRIETKWQRAVRNGPISVGE